jgi:hypothetical protein
VKVDDAAKIMNLLLEGKCLAVRILHMIIAVNRRQFLVFFLEMVQVRDQTVVPLTKLTIVINHHVVVVVSVTTSLLEYWAVNVIHPGAVVAVGKPVFIIAIKLLIKVTANVAATITNVSCCIV